jgi:hypothetical protein
MRESLRNDAISQSDELNCMLISVLLSICYLYVYGFFGIKLEGNSLLAFAFAISTNYLGICLTYQSNGGEQGRDFLRRAIVLSVPLNISALALQLVLVGIAWFAFPYLHREVEFADPSWVWQLTLLVIFNVIVIWYWWRMRLHMTQISKN